MNISPNFSPQRWKESLSDFTPPFAFKATDIDVAHRWQRSLRRQLIRRLGGLPKRTEPPKVKLLETTDCSDYERQSLSFGSQPGLNVFAYLLLPKERPAKSAALLCLHGHGYGVDALVGLDEYGAPRETPDYHNNFALEAVKRGYIVMAPELLGFGRRREGNIAPGSHESSCQTLSGAALMLGHTMAGWRVFDAQCCLDYLETRDDVDAHRLGTIGISGGGLNALYLAAVDQRLKATVVSGFLNSWQGSIMGVPHCVDNFVPGLALDARLSDIAGLVAPRALWCESGEQDNIFPVAEFRRALKETKAVYELYGAREQIGGETFPRGHEFFGEGAWPFLEKHL
jgi:hypothetical protein